MEKHYQNIVDEFYRDEDCYHKALSSAKNLENSMNVKYSKDGSTNCHFRMNEYSKYFSFEALIKKSKKYKETLINKTF